MSVAVVGGGGGGGHIFVGIVLHLGRENFDLFFFFSSK